ncbi:hypothetical protein [Caulobacter sp. S45]|uniref:hypothetical protein n=1 Tax=Caulobacter sp. S45 TaxID=1641861 RepID=UPI001574F7B5|nr:hypothetical protein [Caulobacter sp. S45]
MRAKRHRATRHPYAKGLRGTLRGCGPGVGLTVALLWGSPVPAQTTGAAQAPVPAPQTEPKTVHTMQGYPLVRPLHGENAMTGYTGAARTMTGYAGTPIPAERGPVRTGAGSRLAAADLGAAPAKPTRVKPLVEIDRKGVPWEYDSEHSAWRNLVTGMLTIAPPER